MWSGNVAASSVCRLARRLCHVRGQTGTPARRMIRRKCGFRFAPSRYRPITASEPPTGDCSNTSSSGSRISGNSGMIRSDLPSWCSVFGLRTVRRLCSQSTSDQRSARASLGTRSPPNRESAISSRHSASGAASSTRAIVSRETNSARAGFTCAPALSSANGFVCASPRRPAQRKICRAYMTVRLIVAGEYPCCLRLDRHPSASDALIVATPRASPKNCTSDASACLILTSVLGLTSTPAKNESSSCRNVRASVARRGSTSPNRATRACSRSSIDSSHRTPSGWIVDPTRNASRTRSKPARAFCAARSEHLPSRSDFCRPSASRKRIRFSSPRSPSRPRLAICQRSFRDRPRRPLVGASPDRARARVPRGSSITMRIPRYLARRSAVGTDRPACPLMNRDSWLRATPAPRAITYAVSSLVSIARRIASVSLAIRPRYPIGCVVATLTQVASQYF